MIITLIAPGIVLSSCNSDLDDSKSSGSITSGGTNGGGSSGGTVIPPGSPGNPSAPNTLLVKAYSSSVLLAWTPPGKAGPYTYGVYRRTATGSFQQLANSLNVANFNDTTAQNGIAYTYKVRATNLAGNSSDTNEAQAEAIASFSITSLVQSASNDVTITWTPGAGAEKYDIVTGTGNGDFNTVLMANASSPAVLTGLAPGSTYQIQVIAKNSVGLGSEVRSSTVMRAVLMSAFAFTLGANAQGLTVTWPVVTGADRYQILWGTSTGSYTGSVMVTSPATTTTISGLANSTTYYVMMYAFGGANKFAAGGEVSLLYGAPVSLSWLYTSGTTAQYTSSSAFSNMSFTAGGVCTLGQASFQDINNTPTGFGGGTSTGMIWDATNGYFRLGNAGGCDASTTNCSELNSSWTPQWSNLVQYWKMNGAGAIANSATIPATVGAAATTSGSTAGFTYSASKLSQGINFDGTNNVVTLNGTLPITGTYTFALWVKMTSFASTLPTVISATNSGAFAWEAYLNGTYTGTDLSAYSIGHSTATLTANASGTFGTADLAQWHHIVISYDKNAGTRTRIYKDGVLQTNFRDQITGDFPAHNKIQFGVRADNNACCRFIGSIDDVGVWKTALTTAEVQMLYQRQSANYSGTFASRTFDGGAPMSFLGLDWTTKLPYGKEMPDGGAAGSESMGTYASLASSTLMSGNVALMHLNEPAGTSGASSVKDASGLSNHGTPNNVTFGANGRFQKAASFDGTSSYITMPSITLTNKATYLAWVKIAQHKNYNQILMQIAPGSVNYFGMITDASGRLYFQMNNTSSGTLSLTSTSTVPLNDWALVAITYDGTLGSANGKLFINGVQDSVTGNYTGGLGAGFVGNAMNIGRDAVNAGRIFSGLIDEVGIWNRALSLTEIQQLYRRGKNRLSFQVRGCTTVNAGKTDCTDGATWQGPDGTSNTSFSELNNNTAALAMNGTVKNTAPSMLFTDFTSPVPAKRYFQYRVVADSDDTANLCNYGAGAVPCAPEIVKANISANAYDFTGPSIYGNTGLLAARLTSIVETLGAGGCAGGVGYNLSLDKTNWYYTNGTSWLVADGTPAKSAVLSITNTGLSTFGTQVGFGTVYVRAFLKSSGTQACEIDSITLNGQL